MRSARVLLPLLFVAGCHDTLDLRAGVPSPSPTPSPTATPEPEYGDGHDGPLSVTNGTTTINVCSGVVAVPSGGEVELADATGFEFGDRVLLYQTRILFAVLGDMAPVDLATIGSAGQFELVRVAAVAGTMLTLASPSSRTWSVADMARVQACTVPEYTTVDLAAGATLDAPAWNGDRGGIVAFFADDVVTLDGTLDVDAAGFRGGLMSLPGGGSDVTALGTDDTEGGGKGEGLDGRYFNANGRGNRANGAGGGNAHNAGGGGGGNGGAGGFGGFQGEGSTQLPDTRGNPGSSVLVSAAERLTFGGGGGGGQQDDNAGTDGGRGGGLILVFARDLRGSGILTAAGEDAPDAPGVDGAGGGGAGGTIVVYAGASTFSGTLAAPGGDGGSTASLMNDAGGPGGGGGGGRIAATDVFLVGATIDLTGGKAGILLDGDSFGARPGADGIVETLP